MQKGLLLNESLVNITINRLCQQLIENHDDFSNSVLIGLQPRGIYLAHRIKAQLEAIVGHDVDLGYLDITFFRDDFRRKDSPLIANATDIPFLIEGKNVIIIDDVLFTGRSVRAALDAMTAYGRPELVELLVLIDRKYTRDLPIQPNYVGKAINSMLSQKVLVEWKGEDDATEDNVWLINKETE
ncbi:bifunctional pyr operon transcriptional regulator/uracil phosphoribosyltransferase PyrR [Cyclobacteriaceae bacterium]|nr:bifunctional pyr operon transcriptional regulator/uracil phosphoribosyltransferase PyrR [Cyclobacteriaceae bacterium]